MKKKNIAITLCLITILILSGCGQDAVQQEDSEAVESFDYVQTTIDSDSSITDFQGKPSLILFGGTYCPHCVREVPEIEKTVFEVYKDEVNVWVNVIDQKKFDVENIPQGYNPKLKFNDITSSVCKYVPSWVLLDKDGNIEAKSCGSETKTSEIPSIIDSLLSK